MKKILAVLIAAMLMLTAFAGCSEESTDNASLVAVKIGNQEYTVAEMNFMYISAFNEIYSYYGGYMDITKPLEEQFMSEGVTWHQYIVDYAVNTLKTVTGVYDEALESGFVLPDEYKADLDTFEEQLGSLASQNEMSVEEYLEFNYGKDMNAEALRRMTEIQLYTNALIQDYSTKIEVSDEDIAAHYEANKRNIDTVNFRYYSLFYGETETAEGEEPVESLTKEEAEARANAFAETKTADEFNALALEYTTDEEQKKLFEEGDPTLFPGSTYDATGIEEVSEWLFDEARVQGDTFIFHDEEYSSYLAIMFEERVNPNYSLIDIRHILITPETDEEGNSSDEDWAAAEEKANEIYNGYLAGELTEEAFASLAVEHSKDGNAARGGIYENVAKGQMVQTFNDWCFDETRQPGDTGIVKTPYGYHIMYFSGFGENNLVNTIEPAIKQERIALFITECSADITEEKTENFDKIGGMIDDVVNSANAAAEETEKETKSYTGIIIAVLIAIIVVCIIIIIKNGKKSKNSKEETEATEETEEPVLEATDEDLTEEELLAEEAFEENVSEEETSEEVTEEAAEEETAEETSEESEEKKTEE